MNCAPVVVIGYKGNADVPEAEQTAKFHRAPLMFEANNGNGCWTQNKGSCVKFFEPGESLVVNEECPLDESTMFTGECGPERTLANLPRWSSSLLSFQILCVLVVGVFVRGLAQRLVVPWCRRRRVGDSNLPL